MFFPAQNPARSYQGVVYVFFFIRYRAAYLILHLLHYFQAPLSYNFFLFPLLNVLH